MRGVHQEGTKVRHQSNHKNYFYMHEYKILPTKNKFTYLYAQVYKVIPIA